MRRRRLMIWTLWGCMAAVSLSQDPPAVMIDVNLDVKHKLGEVSTFDRSKFITIHSDHGESDWDGTNFTPDLRNHFLNGYDVYMGRSTGGITWVLKNQVAQDPARPGFASATSMAALGLNSRNNYASKTAIHPYEWRTKQVLGAQFHPFWPDGTETARGWALSQADTPEEPFGTATGEYMGLYIKHFHGSQGRPFPPFVEIINEPLWELVTNGTTPPAKVFDFHNNVATAIRGIYPDVLIGGYTAAFPDFDVRNFDRWHERDKLFFDMSGEHMDFISIHLYDFPAKGGKQLYRKGSNIEATFDMMEHYSMLTQGKIIPFEVSEYGAQVHDLNNSPWTPYRDWLRLKSINSMVLSFMERADKMLMTIPFTVVKAEWGRHDGIPYGPRLMRQAFEGEGESGDHWVYTEQVLFYQLWSDVKGTRVDTWATDFDFLTDAYVDGNQAYVIVNNLEFNAKIIGLNTFFAGNNTIEGIQVKHLFLNGSTPVLETTDYTEMPASLNIGSEGTMVIAYSFSDAIAIPDSSVEEKNYATTYLQEIQANNEITFQIDSVNTGTTGESILRLGIGRDHGLSLTPLVLFNDSALVVPEDFRGGAQTQRDNFFGVIEIPVPYEFLKASNTIVVTFPDQGGHVSSVALQTFAMSREIQRSETPDKFNVKMSVVDKITGAPIEGATVSFDTLEYITNAVGQAQADTISTGNYSIHVSAPGYDEWQMEELNVNDNVQLLIKLAPTQYEVRLQINEKELHLPISNASVIAGTASANSDANGEAMLVVPVGASSIQVTKSYFKDHMEELMISKDTLVRVELERLQADAKFRIYGADGSTRERDASVTIGDTTIITNALGLATFKALKVDTSYLYNVNKEGFQLYSGELVMKKDTTVEITLLVGISSVNELITHFSLYPNPPGDQIFVSWMQKGNKPATIEIRDVTGKVHSLHQVEGKEGINRFGIDLTRQQHGIYLISVKYNDGYASGKFTIE